MIGNRKSGDLLLLERKYKDTAFFMPMLRSRGIYRLEIQGFLRAVLTKQREYTFSFKIAL